ncbi:hypothetical protein CBR_g32445 [Chara braunii]|uniref:Integrase catalytic domain-containing protein n=1 Tax=Chara braunii TaxID=69332 RepID=A0A388LGL8_CHABU|nr:hypothetical protein CBR_g32445 [Chara braunii]|eukprot:GBG81454.1 hypothetical protein CBR_g32445 [Chara braunii]
MESSGAPPLRRRTSSRHSRKGSWHGYKCQRLTSSTSKGRGCQNGWLGGHKGRRNGRRTSQVDIFQMRQARKKRKALDATTSDGRDFKKMVEDAAAQLDAAKEARRKTMAATQTQGKAKKAVVQEEEEEEPEPQKLTKAQRKAKNLAQGGQGSGRGQVPQAVAMPPPEPPSQASPTHYGLWPGCGPSSHWHGHCSYAPWPMSGPHGSCAGPSVSAASCGWSGPQAQQVSHPNPPPNQPQQPAPQGPQGNQEGGRGQYQGWGRGRGNGGRGGNGRGNGGGNTSGGRNEGWTASGSQGGQEGGRGAGRGRIDWRNAICWYCGQKGYTIKFCHVRRSDEDAGLISTNYDGDMYDKWGYHLDPKTSCGTRKEALRRAEVGEPPAPPTMFRIWQEKEVRSDVRVEEVGENAEVEQERKADTTKAEPIIVQSDAQEEKLVVETIRGRHAAYAFSDDERGRLDVDIIPMIRIHTVPHEPWNLRGARYPNPTDEEKVVNYLDGKIRTHVADYSSGPYASPWFCFVKPNETLRWVQDLQRLNVVTVRDAGGLPNADALSEACAGRAIISLIDLYSDYDQFPVYPSDRPMTAMHAPRGLIHMNVAPQGWTNAVAMVQRHMVRAMQPISPHITQPYIDDLAVKGPKEKDEQEVMPGIRRFAWDHVQDLCKVLDLLKEHNLTASGPKSRHCMSGSTILGFVCDERGRRPDTKKTNKILEWPTPFQTITEVRSFLGTCGFWRIFIKGFAAKTEQLRKLVRQGQDWYWGERQESVIENLKKEFEEGGLVLGVPDHAAVMTKPFIVETDSGPTALGGVLIQRDPNGEERPLRFESRTLNTTERNYSQFKRETLAFPHCLRIFRNYLFGSRFVLRVDATALAGSLRNFAPSDPTIARWLTYIWMFNFELERIPGNKNRADGLSRVDWDNNNQGVIEDAPPVDGFLDSEEDVRLHINSWALAVGNYVNPGRPVWLAPPGHARRLDLVLKPYIEEDSWGMSGVGWMMELALAGKYELQEDPLTIENGALQVGKHERVIGGGYLLANALLQEEAVRNTVLGQEVVVEPGGGDNVIHEREDDDFEEGEIQEAFVMDRGSEFTYAEVKALLKKYGVIAEYTTAAHPQANAPVERGHSTITNLLAKWTNDRPNQWPNFLRVAFFVDNITIRRSTGYAPATLWYGRHATFPIESFLKTWRRQDLEIDLTFEELLDLRARQIGAIEDRIEEAASRTADSRTKDKFRWDKKARVRKEPLKVGDVVLLYDSSL